MVDAKETIGTATARQPAAADRPKVSIVLVTYNRARHLPATLDSLLVQTLGDFELIVSDDCSTDDTRAVCERYAAKDPRLRYRCNPHNLRMPGNLNAALAEVRGEYVAITHDGDVYRPDLLEKWAGALDRHPGAGFVFNAYRAEVPGAEDIVYRTELGECTRGRDFLRRVYIPNWGGCPVHGTAMLRRSSLEAVGPFDPAYSANSDVEMWMRLACHFDVAYLPEPLTTLHPREADHYLLRHYWWERTIDVRLKRQAFQRVGDRSRLARLRFELAARATYARQILPLVKNRRWADVALGLRILLTGFEDVSPPH